MGLMLGIPSIAISQDHAGSRHKVRWDTAREIAPKLLAHFLKTGWRKETCLSINIPDLPPEKVSGFSWTRQGNRTTAGVHIDMREDLREHRYFWLTFQDQEPLAKGNSDCAALSRGEVAVTALSLDRSMEVTAPSMSFEDLAAAGADE